MHLSKPVHSCFDCGVYFEPGKPLLIHVRLYFIPDFLKFPDLLYPLYRNGNKSHPITYARSVIYNPMVNGGTTAGKFQDRSSNLKTENSVAHGTGLLRCCQFGYDQTRFQEYRLCGNMVESSLSSLVQVPTRVQDHNVHLLKKCDVIPVASYSLHRFACRPTWPSTIREHPAEFCCRFCCRRDW